MAAIRNCSDHGFFEGDSCPNCSATGEHVMDSDDRKQLSKFMSGALRHFPDDVNITLNDAGWTNADDLVEAAETELGWPTEDDAAAVVQLDPKGRFEVDGDRIRAAYGHSIDVDLEANDSPVPNTLFHGTAIENVIDIMDEGLQPMSRQHVHLTDTPAEAINVGERHADDPVLLEIDAAAMLDADHEITKRGKEVYTTDAVPPSYISISQQDKNDDGPKPCGEMHALPCGLDEACPVPVEYFDPTAYNESETAWAAYQDTTTTQ